MAVCIMTDLLLVVVYKELRHNMTALNISVTHNDDDGYVGIWTDGGEESGNDNIFNNSANILRMGWDTENYTPDEYQFYAWFRFQNVTIPAGATIDDAVIKVYHSDNSGFDSSDPSEGMIVKAHDINTAPRPANYAQVNGVTRASNTATTSSFIDVDNVESFSGQYYSSADIKAIIQEIVNGPASGGSWASGNDMVFYLYPTSYSEDWQIDWVSKNAGSNPPKIEINYTAAAAAPAAEPDLPGAAFLMFVD